MQCKVLGALFCVTAVRIFGQPAQAAPVDLKSWEGTAVDAGFESVNMKELPDLRLWSILADLSQQQGVTTAGKAAYVASSASDLLLVPLSSSPQTELVLFYHQVSGEYFFLLLDRSQVAGPQIHLWGAGQEELVVTQAGLRLLPAPSAATFRLAEVGPLGQPRPLATSASITSLLDKLKCYLRSIGIDTFTFTSIKAIFSRAGICSEFNVISIGVTAVACVTGGVVACGLGVDTIAACVKCEPTATTYSIGGNAGVPEATVTAGGMSASTDSSGHFRIAGLDAGPYTVTPSKFGCTFSPASRTVTLPPAATGQNFTANCNGTSDPVSWTVEDACGDGIHVRFFDPPHTYPTGNQYFDVPPKSTETFTFDAPEGSTVCLGAVDFFFGVNWCATIYGTKPPRDPKVCCATVLPGGVSKRIKLTC